MTFRGSTVVVVMTNTEMLPAALMASGAAYPVKFAAASAQMGGW